MMHGQKNIKSAYDFVFIFYTLLIFTYRRGRKTNEL